MGADSRSEREAPKVDGAGTDAALEDDEDFLIAVEEASQAGPLPQPDANATVTDGSNAEADPRSFLPAELFASPAPRKRTLISPTRPMPKVATVSNETPGRVPDRGRSARGTDDTAVGAPSLLARATATATPYPPLRVDNTPRPRPERGTKPPMPAPVTVHAKPGPARATKSIVERERLGKEPVLTDAEREQLTKEAKWAEFDREVASIAARGAERSTKTWAPEAPESGPIKTESGPINVRTKTVVPESGPINVRTKTVVPESGPINVRTKTVVPESGPINVRTKTIVPESASARKTAPPDLSTKTVVPDPPKKTTLVPEAAKKTAPPLDTSMDDDLTPEPRRVPAVPGRLERDRAAKGLTQPAPIVPIVAEPLDRTQPSMMAPSGASSTPIVVAPAPVVAPGHTPPPATPAAAPARKRKAALVPNWAIAGAFALVGLSVGVLIATSAGDDDESTRADAAPRVASAAPDPTPKDPPARAPEAPAPPSIPDPPVAPAPAEPVLEEAQPEIVAIAETTPQELATPVPTEPTPRKRWRRRPKPEAPPQTLSQPDPEPEPEPAPRPKPKPRPPSASALLSQANAALAKGQNAQAYRLAKRSHAASGDEDALVTMAKAACRNDDKDGALSALRQLPLLDRGPVRRDCRKNGSRIGL